MRNCKSCWWHEGGKCYDGEPERDNTGTSTRMAQHICKNYWNKRDALGGIIPNDKLIILSEGVPTRHD